MTDRPVRVRSSFYRDVQSLRPERGPNGEPSAADFLAFDLPEIIAEFATNWDKLPRHLPDHPFYRELVGHGLTVYAYQAVGQLGPDEAVELVRIYFDIEGLPQP